ncbi:MAG: type II toxin-antitoxin system VapC family toxin [Brevinematales bacterium]|nr:type II toxin-antitoxin system VapC family toxin [Brevinematales bacterium]
MIDVFLDTNILIYSMDMKSEFFSQAKSILYNPEYKFFISSKNISEFVAAVTRYRLMAYSALVQCIEAFCSSFNMLFPDDVSNNIFISLIKEYKPERNRVFDIEILSIMLANKITKIATYNEKDFTGIPGIEIIG